MLQQTSSPYNRLIAKLDAFIRRYYDNLLIRGAIFCGSYVWLFSWPSICWSITFICPKLCAKPPSSAFYFSSLSLYRPVFYLAAAQYYRLGKIIRYDQAAQIIGAHFTEVKDKLLNILQLHRMPARPMHRCLLAAIDQKAIQLKPIDFSFAVDLSKTENTCAFLFHRCCFFVHRYCRA